MRLQTLVLATLVVVVPSALARADEPASIASASGREGLPTMDVTQLLERASTDGRRLLLDPRVPPRLVVGNVEPRAITYPVLLAILRNNGFVAVPAHGVVSIVPDANLRQFATPLISGEPAGIADDEVVTEVHRLAHASAAALVPILRPLIPQYGHLAAFAPQNALILTDRYANLKRVLAIVRELDKEPVKTVGAEPADNR